MQRVAHFIEGQRRAGGSEIDDLDVFNPATGEVSARVPVADATASSHSIAIEMPAWGVHVVVSSKSRDGGRSPGSSAPITPRKKLAWVIGSVSQWKKW